MQVSQLLTLTFAKAELLKIIILAISPIPQRFHIPSAIQYKLIAVQSTHANIYTWWTKKCTRQKNCKAILTEVEWRPFALQRVYIMYQQIAQAQRTPNPSKYGSG